MGIADRFIDVLLSDKTSSIAFSYSGEMISGSGYRYLADLIRQDCIRFRLWEDRVFQLRMTQTGLNVCEYSALEQICRVPRVTFPEGKFDEALALHEMTHALHHVGLGQLRGGARFVSATEGAAYVSQGYYLLRCGITLDMVRAQADDAAQSLLLIGMMIAQRLIADRSSVVSTAEETILSQHLRAIPFYRAQMSSLAVYPPFRSALEIALSPTLRQ